MMCLMPRVMSRPGVGKEPAGNEPAVDTSAEEIRVPDGSIWDINMSIGELRTLMLCWYDAPICGGCGCG